MDQKINIFSSFPSVYIGLVHRAILLSGSSLSPWSIIPDPDTVREEVSQQMACHLDSNGQNKINKDVTDDITNCLLDKPLEALLGVRLPTVRYIKEILLLLIVIVIIIIIIIIIVVYVSWVYV